MLYKVTKEELQRIINKLLKNRALGPDNITNKVICIITPLILKKLAQIVIKCLIIGLFKRAKEVIYPYTKKGRKKKLFITRYL